MALSGARVEYGEEKWFQIKMVGDVAMCDLSISSFPSTRIFVMSFTLPLDGFTVFGARIVTISILGHCKIFYISKNTQ